MDTIQATITRLTELNLSDDDRRGALRLFAAETGWHPSDEILRYRDTDSYASGHLLVEHGLDHTAAISFLAGGAPFSGLTYQQQTTLVGISYNNLIDWHLFPDRNGLYRIYNRCKPFKIDYVSIHEDSRAYRAESFDRVVGRRENPNLPALDDALLGTVSKWRRILASELSLTDETESIAELFNAVFFVRALEDHRRNTGVVSGYSLLELIDRNPSKTVGELLAEQLRDSPGKNLPSDIFDFDLLKRFDSIDVETRIDLLSDFYQNRFAPYQFDFSLMSKHALSRIYERYISILRPQPMIQQTLFAVSESVSEQPRKDLGEIYTPQYIARFFVRFLQENMTPSRFRSIRAIDPACGSGMFLRTLLEMQCDPARTRDIAKTAEIAFRNVRGIDIEPNAIKAARLSLYLLHLVLTDHFPQSNLELECENALETFANPSGSISFDAVIANPPYVRWEKVPPEWHQLILDYLGDDISGRPDLYLAFLKIALENASVNGYFLFVLPHTFLLSANASRIRRRIHENFWIRHVVDLSAMKVFDAASSYPVLLIAERKQQGVSETPAFVTKCTGFVGEALQAALEERTESNSFYSVYTVEQDYFGQADWRLLYPGDYQLARKMTDLPRLDSIYQVNQGVNSGSDSVFIRPSAEVPSSESALYVPLLRDREMERYRVPNMISSSMFYPFEGDRLLDEAEISKKAPETWAYLESHYPTLSGRASVRRGDFPWWRPERPRLPSTLLRPKIVGPHLMLFPKFSLDIEGELAVSRTIYISHETDDEDALWYLLAVLNSKIGHWQIATQSHKYSRGYARVEAVTLRNFQLPSPSAIQSSVLRKIVDKTKQLHSEFVQSIQEEIDEMVAEQFDVTVESVPSVSMEKNKA
ncbi:HsdM family class I SAM-dependent methyltransferase [Rosistilla oblonga]|uniref:HsdM family class I SAM-dependent methyltransferase n=1 Tax=Rosistilla oblonga TaxID=2527990 RepID=UPI003A9820EC